MKRIAVLGATGSIGASTLDLIARHPDRFSAHVLAAHRNVEALVALCLRFRPAWAVIADAAFEADLRQRLAGHGLSTRVLAGSAGLTEAATLTEVDTVVAAIVGAAGLESTLAAARAGKRLLLANKEAIVMAGPLLLAALSAGGGELLPLDSEHNAVFQCLPGGRPELTTAGVRRLVLTASGGPFRGRTRTDLAAVTPAMACAHPNWSMGRKISVDSATLMNKGLEVIEAHFLFGAPAEAIDVVVHPQSIVHSLVEYLDGSVLAQLGHPDMRTAIAHALAWPGRVDAGVRRLDLVALGQLGFEAPDRATFTCLDLAYAALRAGGTAPAILNAANEEAVAAFLDGRLPFLAIAEVVAGCLDRLAAEPVRDLAGLLDSDLTARREAQRIIAAMAG
ncbi:MAG: 1-deoxy-D-xylulose-5-phosphate reductoisomerase [Luteimonas sp.]|uniref:1-deoxy-D-xylulose-5-phosphate reductoisomerase n=1 Tax=Dokdonella sp. TaxID=2291710 RepID=UPI0025BA6D3D|nr:1-deoxy-D-xylulose-5-phosphate reductoisomerase [Dokdonella sp.]MBX3692916.1 1-deoxy-D-xylulose-5-phosphate reductoisomerase [Dokdonella sp.]MCW5579855.1 1-deoxy-D-xylulose-5-phosphate reductoisomerase [Luteimonas sp.]